MMYMPIIDILKPKGQALFAEYLGTDTVPLAYEVCWSEYTPAVEACMKKVVADAAFEGDPAAVYGKLVDMGATMIQTDRPELLISYLRARGLHD